MDRNKNIIPYSASDIERYRKGELSAREMHDLEQAALDDPFLADAIDGLSLHPAPLADLINLQERLDQMVGADTRHGKIKRIQRRVAIAAALILLLGIGFTFFTRHNDTPYRKRPAESAAVPGPATVAVQTAPPAAQAAAQPATEPKAAANGRSTASLHHRLTTETAKSPGLQSPVTANSPGNLQSAIVSVDKDKASANSDYEDSALAAENLALTSKDTIALANSLFRSRALAEGYFNSSAKAAPLVLSGKVLDLQNHPLAGAFLAFNGKSGNGTITDKQGQFRISLQARDSTQHLTVSLIGYNHASLSVNDLLSENQKDNIIRLRPSTAGLDEVVVVGYGSRRKETEVAAPSDSNEKLDTLWTNATPVIGRQTYLQYLEVGKKKLGLDTTITGTETVSFVVGRNGSLSGFKIEQSLSPAHDAGILRLVTDGPAWRLIRGKMIRTSVTVNF